jgi:acyl-CoA thioester hydrolase
VPFVHRLRVRYVECDMQGHVFNGNYLTWFDIAHTELLRAAYGPYARIVESGVEFVVAEASLRYRAPARFDDELEVHVTLDPPTNSSLISNFEVKRGDELLTEGRLRHVCVDAETFAKAPWPNELRDAFAPYVAQT